MDDEAAFLFFFVIALSALNWIRLSLANRKLRRQLQRVAEEYGLPASALNSKPSRVQIDSGTPRMEALENQVDQMAGQMDRLAESQEFMSRILTDRLDKLNDARVTTPH